MTEIDMETGEITEAEDEATETPEEPGGEPDEPDQEPGDDEPGDEPEAQPDEPAQGQVDEKEIEKLGKALEKYREQNAGRVGKLFGADCVDLLPCPLCEQVAPGFIWDPRVAPLFEETENSVRQLLGMNVRGQFKPHPNADPCPTCDGLGSVVTPSKVPGFDVVDCPTCLATGRILTATAPVAQLVQQENGTAATVTGPTVILTDEPPEAAALRAKGFQVFKLPNLDIPAAVTS